MNVALILASGVDPRFQMVVPKQFIITKLVESVEGLISAIVKCLKHCIV